VEATEEKASWVLVTVTGDPELANKMKAFLGLVLDWAILEENTAFKLRHHLKFYDQMTALKSTDRLQFYIVKKLERERGEKAGILIVEEVKSKDTKKL